MTGASVARGAAIRNIHAGSAMEARGDGTAPIKRARDPDAAIPYHVEI